MRSAHADYSAIEEALDEHQLQTVRDYAVTQGVAPAEWWKQPVCCAVATALAVHNIVRHWKEGGVGDRQALTKAAAQLDLDVETLQRHRRLIRSRRSEP